MQKALFSLFLFAVTIVFLSNVEGEPEVLMVDINPDNVDNQQDEEINFDGDCNICNEQELSYFYWNSSIDGILHEGSNPMNINFVLSSSTFHTGEHNVTLQVRDNNGTWSIINTESTAVLNVAGRDDDGGGDISVNFAITPPSLHLGETARFEACTEMQPEPQPCVGDINPDLSFNWEIQWEGETNWSYLGNQEAFDYVNFEEGDHIVRLTITDNSDGSEASDTAEITILPPIPSVSISGPGEITIKEGEILDLIATCYDNELEEIDCTYEWEIWENEDNGDLLFTYDTQDISLNDLTNEINKYDVMVRGADGTGTYSQWSYVFVTVNPPNEGPSAAITIHPDSLGGLTPEYYQLAELTFSSASSNDPDGELVSFNWWFNNEIVSNSANWISSFNDTGIYQVKLEVQDDNGVWSSKVSTNFKIIENTAPTVAFTWEQTENSFVFTSTSSDAEGSVVSFEWMIGDELISNEENCTWTASESGTYTVTFRAMDDGGMWSETSQTIESKVVEQKNFVAHFSSKTINPGDSFNMDFSNTTGTVDYFEIVVNNPNGSKQIFYAYHPVVEYTLIFDKKGTYALDITVIWADGVPQGGLSDWYGPTIYVGVDDSEDNSDDEGAPKTPEEESGLPSLSMVVALIVTSLVAINRRQR